MFTMFTLDARSTEETYPGMRSFQNLITCHSLRSCLDSRKPVIQTDRSNRYVTCTVYSTASRSSTWIWFPHIYSIILNPLTQLRSEYNVPWITSHCVLVPTALKLLILRKPDHESCSKRDFAVVLFWGVVHKTAGSSCNKFLYLRSRNFVAVKIKNVF
jgi:hypothetical protein